MNESHIARSNIDKITKEPERGDHSIRPETWRTHGLDEAIKSMKAMLDADLTENV